MADVLSLREVADGLIQFSTRLQNASAQARALLRYRNKLQAEGNHPDGIKSLVNAQYDELVSEVTQIATDLAAFDDKIVYDCEWRPGTPTGNTGLKITITGLTISGGDYDGKHASYIEPSPAGHSIFGAAGNIFAAGDEIILENCENPDNNGLYIVAAATSTKLTVFQNQSATPGEIGYGNGVDNTNDTSARIRLRER